MKDKEFKKGDIGWFFDTYVWQEREAIVVCVYNDHYACVSDNIRFSVPKNELFKTKEELLLSL